jgi:RND family efflux transporter MFP subunit
MNPRRLLIHFGALMTLTACSEEPGHGHAHDGSTHAHHGTFERAREAVTSWGERSQLFVEFPALAVGEDSPFAAHLTVLADHEAIDTGVVTVSLSGAGGPVEEFTVDAPTSSGIFRPVIRPAHKGLRKVTLRLDSITFSEVHEVGEFEVFGSLGEAGVVAPEWEDPEEISYLLEQQWRVPFRVEQAVSRPMRPNVPAFARLVQPTQGVSVVIAPRDGRVVATGETFPAVGGSVEQGAVLFELTASPHQGDDPATLDLAVEQADIRVGAARREVERLGGLVSQGVVSGRRLDEARSILATHEAELKSARRRKGNLAQSARVRGRRDALRVPAPIAGAISELSVSPGTWVAKGDALATIVDRDRLVLTVEVPEAYVGRVRDVSGAWFRIGGVPGTFEVPREALISVGTQVDARTRTLPVRFRLDNTRRTLFAGMMTRAHLIADAPRESTAVPVSAVIDDSGTDVVYVQTGGESFERRAVKLGIRDGDHIEITRGIAPGEWVVAAGGYGVKIASTSTESTGHGHAH